MAGVEPGRNEPLAPPPGSSVAAAKAEDVNIVMEQMSSSLPAVPTSPHMAASGPAAGEGPVRTDAAASSTLGEKKTARVLCDYDAMDRTELSLGMLSPALKTDHTTTRSRPIHCPPPIALNCSCR